MDQERGAFPLEMVRCSVGLLIIFLTADWFVLSWLRWFVAAQLLLSVAVVRWLFLREGEPNPEPAACPADAGAG